MSTQKQTTDKLNEAIEILRQLVYYSQLHTVVGVRPADMLTHDEVWRNGQKFLWENCKISDGKYVFSRTKSLKSDQ